MIHRELTFYPETESTRDLIYSEYTSLERSIHVLLQDNGLHNYRFLLEGYREIVTRYASVSKLQSAPVFLRDLAARLEQIAGRVNFGAEDLRSIGCYVLLRGTDACYLMASGADDIYLYDDKELLRLSDAPQEYVERLHFGRGAMQEELFPQRLRDSFLIFRLAPEYVDGRDIILGCGEEEKGSVVESLAEPANLKDGRATLSSKFITRKMLALRFQWRTPAAVPHRRRRFPDWRSGSRPVAAAAGLVVVVVAAMSWLSGRDGSTPVEERQADLAEKPATGAASVTSPPASEPVAPEPIRLAERWRKTQPQPVTSSPVGHEKWMVYGARDGGLYVVDRGTGAEVWTTNSGSGIGATPVIDNKVVVAADYQGRVQAFHLETGRQVWKAKLPGRIVSSPSIMHGRVLIGCYDGFAYCLDMANGEVVWKQKTRGRIRGSATGGQGHFYVPSYDGNVYALAGATGAVRWKTHLGGSLAGAAVIYRERVIVGSPGGEVYTLSAADGSVLWRYRTGAAVKSAARVRSGRVYIGSNDRFLYCLNLADGTLIWKYKTGGMVLSRPAVHQGRVFVGSYDSYLYCVDAMTGALVDRYKADGVIYSSPLVDEESVYFGTMTGSFICLAKGTGSAL